MHVGKVHSFKYSWYNIHHSGALGLFVPDTDKKFED